MPKTIDGTTVISRFELTDYDGAPFHKGEQGVVVKVTRNTIHVKDIRGHIHIRYRKDFTSEPSVKTIDIDLGKLEEYRKLRAEIIRGGGVRDSRISPAPSRKRARVIDDLSSDTRLVKLSRYVRIKHKSEAFMGRPRGENNEI